MSGDAAWPTGEPGAPSSQSAARPVFPAFWVLVAALFYALITWITSDPGEGHPAAYRTGRVIGAAIVPFLLSGLVWLVSRRRDLTIALAYALLLVPALGAVTSTLGVRKATREYRESMMARSQEYERLFVSCNDAGGCAPATLVEESAARERLRMYQQVQERADALVAELQDGDTFGVELDEDTRRTAWLALYDTPWYQRSLALMQLQARMLTGVTEYVGLLVEHHGSWTSDDDGFVTFAETVPDEHVERFNNAADEITARADEIDGLQPESSK